MATEIQVNSILAWADHSGLERVLWIHPDNSYVIVIDMEDEAALPAIRKMDEIIGALNNGHAAKCLNDPYAHILLNSRPIPEKQLAERDQAWETIQSLVSNEPDIYLPEERGRLITEALNRWNVTKVTVYKRLRRFWVRGKVVNALLPDFHKCGGPGGEKKPKSGVKLGRPPRIARTEPELVGINVVEEVKQIFRVAIKRFYNSEEKYPLKRTYDLMIEKFFSQGTLMHNGAEVPVVPHTSTLPSFRQFRYFFEKEKDIESRLRSREGSRRFNLRHRAVLGESRHMAFGPGSIYQIDATVADVYLVSQFNANKIIGRPIVYVLIDAFSRMITGLYVGLEGPSWVGAMMALANATADKAGFCASYGNHIEAAQWPCRYLPEAILADRGEMMSGNADHVAQALNIRIHNTPPYRADWKGIVEQNFRLCNLRAIHWLPGAVKERYRERGTRDYRLDATLTLQEFTSIMLDLVMYHNREHRMPWYRLDEFQIMDEVEPIPLHLWNWGLANRSGYLREMDPNIIKLNLMPHAEGSVTALGIRVNGMYYSCERAVVEQWFLRARTSGSWKVQVAYDPRKIDTVYLCLDGGKNIEPCKLLAKDERFGSYWLEEILDYQEREKEQAVLTATDSLQARVKLNAIIGQKVTQAKERNRDQVASDEQLSKTQKVKNIRANRAEEKEKQRSQESWDLSAGKPVSNEEAPSEKSNGEANPSAASPASVAADVSSKPFDRKKKLLSVLQGEDNGDK